MSKEKFRAFVYKKPHLASFVQNGTMTWQKFYELYDLYGETSSVWEKYEVRDTASTVNKINNLIKSVDVESIKEHITQAQKALSLVQELTSKDTSNNVKPLVAPRPINKFFED